MTNEEWDRKTEFLLNQQAKFDAGLQELKEAQIISEQKIAEVAATAERASQTASHAVEAVLGVAGVVAKLAETVTSFITATQEGFREVFDRMKHTEDKIDVLVNSQMRTDENIRDTDKQLRETDKQLRDLADLFKRHIREGHEGLSGAEN